MSTDEKQIIEGLLSGIDQGIEKQVVDSKLVLRSAKTHVSDEKYLPGMYACDGTVYDVKNIIKEGDKYKVIVNYDGVDKEVICTKLIKL